jgi:hypothetical protein
MSHKAAKALRKILRAGGNNPRRVELTRKPYHIAAPMLGSGPGCTFIPRNLAANCGRALYLGMKKLGRARAFA